MDLEPAAIHACADGRARSAREPRGRNPRRGLIKNPRSGGRASTGMQQGGPFGGSPCVNRSLAPYGARHLPELLLGSNGALDATPASRSTGNGVVRPTAATVQ